MHPLLVPRADEPRAPGASDELGDPLNGHGEGTPERVAIEIGHHLIAADEASSVFS
jgi:hypothetical protein